MNEYIEQAEKFLKDSDTTFNIVWIGCFPYLDDEEENRDVYSVTLSNDRHVYNFRFGDSIRNTQERLGTWKPQRKMTVYEYERAKAKLKKAHKKPTPYDVLACLTHYDPDTFRNFCADFGYDEDSRKAEKIYLAVQDEWENVRKLFNDEQLEQLAEIN